MTADPSHAGGVHDDDSAPVDHLALAKAAVASPFAGELAQVHALIAIAESLRGDARGEYKPAEELRDGDRLADNSTVVRVDEPFEEPECVYVSVARGKNVWKLVLLRCTPVALAA